MHTDSFWSGQSSQPKSSISTAHIKLNPLVYEHEDGLKRRYFLRGTCVYNRYEWDGRPDTPRWCVEVDACDTWDGEAFRFHTMILWSAVLRDAMSDYHYERYKALTYMARERIDDYLRTHPYPQIGNHPFRAILLEFA